MADVSMGEAGLMGGVFVMGMTALEVAKAAVGKIVAKRNGSLGSSGVRAIQSSAQLDRIESGVHHLDELHAPKDIDGIPLWYIPRSWGETLKDVSKSLDSVAHLQEATTAHLEIIAKTQKEMMEMIRQYPGDHR